MYGQSRTLITSPIDDSSRILMAHSSHPLAQPAFEMGPVDPALKMDRMLLVLGSGPDQENALQGLLDSQHDKTSPNYHHWLSPETFAEQFSPSLQDVQQVRGWLEEQGFVVTTVARSRRWIEFSGTAAQVKTAFQTEMRNYQIDGTQHIANSVDISIPRALAPVVRGVVSLHDFFKKPLLVGPYQAHRDPASSWQVTIPNATFNNGTLHLLAPGDFAQIYSLNRLYQNGVDGSGQTIAIVARSNIRLNDIEDFRRIFNLPANDPNVILNGPAAGFLSSGDEVEADLDVEWSGAVAPKATIDLVISASTVTTDGVDLSAAYIVDNNLAPVMSVSFGQCEQLLGPAENAFYTSLWQQAATQGISVFVASGDDGAAGCDNPALAPATGGLAVSGLASTPFNTAVGGTEFNENGNDSSFWNSSNTTGFGSAQGYIPETVWNESCDPNAPNSPCPGQGNLFASAGGASSLYVKPAWQAAPGVPSDGKRDLPDVSLAAAGGHDGYLMCFVGSCQTVDGPNGQPILIGATVVGGTSAASPSMAGVMALVNQKMGVRQGLANYLLYRMAANQNGAECNSSNLNNPLTPSPCVIYDIASGNNGVPGQTGFSAQTGFDFATGLGSINAANFVNAWNSAIFQSSTTALQAQNTSVQHGQPVPITVNVQAATGAGTPSGTFVLMTDKFGPAAVGPLSGGSFSGSFASLPGGQYNLTAHYQGDGVFGGSDSLPVAMNITPESANVVLTSWQQGALGPFQTSTIGYGDFLFFHVAVNGLSGNGTPTGTVTFKDGTTVLGSISLSGKGQGEFVNDCFEPFFGLDSVTCLDLGAHSITAVYSGDSSFTGTTSLPLAVSVNASQPTVLLQPNAFTLAFPQQLSLLVEVGGSGPAIPTGTVTFFEDGTAITGPVTLTQPTPLSRPQAVFTGPVAVGTHVFTVTFVSTNSHYTSNIFLFPGPATINVTASSGAATQVSLAVDNSAPTAGQTINYTATISSAQSSPPLTGTVTLLGAFGPFTGPVAVSNGQATFPFSWSFGGPQTLIAQYSGDTNFQPGTSAPLSVNVAKITPTLTLTTSAAAPQSGQQVTLTVTTASPVPLSARSSGEVQFFDSLNGAPAQPIGSTHFTQIGDKFVFLFSLPVVLADGSHVVTAQYLPDGTFNAATSNAVAISVAPPSFHISASGPLAVVAGQSGSVTLTVTPAPGLNATITLSCGSGVPSGATCSINPPSVVVNGSPVNAQLTLSTAGPSPAVALASARPFRFAWPLGAAGLACLVLTAWSGKQRGRTLLGLMMVLVIGMNLSCGGGGGSFKPGPTPTPAPPGTTTSTSLSSSAVKTADGSPLTLTAVVSSTSGQPLTGSVAFQDGSAEIGVEPLSNNQAKLQLISIGVGTHSLTAKYSGDSKNPASTSNVLNEVMTGSQQLRVTATSGGQAQTVGVNITLQ